jgi:hypothetical protein
LVVKCVAERVVLPLAVLAALLHGCGASRPAPSSGDAAPAEPPADAAPARETPPAAIAEARPSDQRAPEASSADASPEAAAPAADGAPPLRCNGHEALCDRRLDQVVFPATHNSMSNAEDGWLAPNQTHGLRRQLDDGVRALLVDTHAWRGGSYLCHSICELGSRPLVEGLRDLTRFLRENPHEVLVLIIEDGLSAAETEAAFRAAELLPFTYTHPGGAWPTLRQMIADGRRLLVTAERGRPPPAWYHHAWDLLWDTPYTFRSRDDFSCRLNRGSRDHALFLLNHWIENPLATQGQSATANARDVLLDRARQCQAESGKLPNFVAVNHYSVGALFEVVRVLNGL